MKFNHSHNPFFTENVGSRIVHYLILANGFNCIIALTHCKTCFVKYKIMISPNG